MYKRITALFIVIVFVLSSVVSFAIDDRQVISKKEYEIFALSEISRINLECSSKYPDCNWSSSTVICDSVPLFSPDNVINGMVFYLETDKERTGYIQIMNFFGSFITSSFSFKGAPACEGLMNVQLLDNRDNYEKELYYIGTYTYCLRKGDCFTVIDSLKEYDYEKVKSAYNAFVEDYEASYDHIIGYDAKARHSNNLISRSISFSPVVMNSFSSITVYRPNGTGELVTEHCSPTAATNVMLYFRSTGASPLSTNLSDSTIFEQFFYLMDTNLITTSNTPNTSGTSWSNIKPAYDSFCSGRYCVPTHIAVVPRLSVSWTTITNHIDAGAVLQVEVDDYLGNGGHSIVAFDYSGSSLYVATGWSSSLHYELISTSNIGQFIYVRYN